jgi:hypothetical protein
MTNRDIEIAIKNLRETDGEHGIFWVVVYDEDSDETVLELHKNYNLFVVLEDKDYQVKLKSIESSKLYFDLLLKGSLAELKEKLAENKVLKLYN